MAKRANYVHETHRNRPARSRRPDLAVHLRRPHVKLSGGLLDGELAFMTVEQHASGSWPCTGGSYDRQSNRANDPWTWSPDE